MNLLNFVLATVFLTYVISYWVFGLRVFTPEEPPWLPWIAVAFAYLLTDD